MEDPKRTPWRCIASVCVAGVHCWEILGVSRSGEYEFLSLLSIYSRNFLHVFIVCRLLLGILFALLYLLYVMCFCCFGLVVSTCQAIGLKDYSDDAFMW